MLVALFKEFSGDSKGGSNTTGEMSLKVQANK